MLTAIALVVAAVVLLCFEATRLIGAAGIVMLIVFFPLMTLVMLLVAGIVFYFVYFKRSLRTYEKPQLRDGLD